MRGSTTSVHRPRWPLESPLYRLVQRHFDALVAVHEEQFQSQYGRLRGAARRAVEKFLDCGVPTGCAYRPLDPYREAFSYSNPISLKRNRYVVHELHRRIGFLDDTIDDDVR